MKITLSVSYGTPPKHAYNETWEKLDLFCPHCGKKEVWHDFAAGDYYVGEQHLCSACGCGFYLPGGVECQLNDEQGNQRLAAISEATR